MNYSMRNRYKANFKGSIPGHVFPYKYYVYLTTITAIIFICEPPSSDLKVVRMQSH